MIIGLLAAAARSAAEDKPAGGKGMRVAAFGDSITKNTGKLKWPHWTEMLRQRYGWELINAGVAGNTTAQALKRMDKDVLERKPQLVLISFGMNDHVMRAPGRPNVPLEEFEKNLRTMVERVRAAGARPVLVTTNAIVEGDRNNKTENYYYNRHDPAFYAGVGGAQAWLDRYIEATRKVAKEMKVTLADVRKAGEAHGARELTTDGVHPSKLGNEVYAQAVSEALEGGENKAGRR